MTHFDDPVRQYQYDCLTRFSESQSIASFTEWQFFVSCLNLSEEDLNELTARRMLSVPRDDLHDLLESRPVPPDLLKELQKYTQK